MAAAMAQYLQGGSAAVSFRRVAQDLGMSHMQPYRFFADKATLTAAMRTHCFRELLSIISRSDPSEEAPPLTRLYAITTGVFSHLFSEPSLYRLMFSLNQPPPRDFPELLEARRAIYGYLRRVVQAGIDSGDLAGDPDEVLHLAWAMSHGLFTLHVSHQLVHGRSLDELVQPALELMFGRLTTAPQHVDQLREAALHTANRGDNRNDVDNDTQP